MTAYIFLNEHRSGRGFQKTRLEENVFTKTLPNKTYASKRPIGIISRYEDCIACPSPKLTGLNVNQCRRSYYRIRHSNKATKIQRQYTPWRVVEDGA